MRVNFEVSFKFATIVSASCLVLNKRGEPVSPKTIQIGVSLWSDGLMSQNKKTFSSVVNVIAYITIAPIRGGWFRLCRSVAFAHILPGRGMRADFA